MPFFVLYVAPNAVSFIPATWSRPTMRSTGGGTGRELVRRKSPVSEEMVTAGTAAATHWHDVAM